LDIRKSKPLAETKAGCKPALPVSVKLCSKSRAQGYPLHLSAAIANSGDAAGGRQATAGGDQ